MTAGKNIWIIVEHTEGVIKDASLETINAGKMLARNSGGGAVTAVVPSAGQTVPMDVLIHHGADRVLTLKHDALAHYANAAYLYALIPCIEDKKPDIILIPATSHGKDLAPALAAKLGAALATDCISLETDAAGGLKVKRPIYAGKAIATLTFDDAPIKILTLRPKVFRGEGPDSSRKGELEEYAATIPDSLPLKIKEIVREAGAALDITEARIVVSGGMGMQKPENFRLLEELAQTLGAAVGASRPVVDNGWRPFSCQVGQTGRTVSPDLYIACGISGAVQHLAGMSSSKCIIAINKDPYAPIFSIADYGIVGDILEIAPLLTQEFKNLLKSRQ